MRRAADAAVTNGGCWWLLFASRFMYTHRDCFYVCRFEDPPVLGLGPDPIHLGDSMVTLGY